MFVLLYSLLLASASWAAGGDWVGNGGDILQCKKPGSRNLSYELLDFYEGRINRHLKPDLGPEGTSFDDKVHYVLERLKLRNPTRAALYLSWYKDFFVETGFYMDGHLSEIPDTGPMVIPNGCATRQIAAQLPDDQILPGDHRYVIDLDLWNKISEETRAGLILHELVYREAISNRQTNSKRVRYFNQYMSSSAFAAYGSGEILALVRVARFRYVDYFGIPLDLSSASYRENGALLKAYATGGEWQPPGEPAPLPLKDKWVTFDEAGAILGVEG